MSLPIEPETGLFPSDDEPAFVRSPEVEELAGEVMDEWPEFEPIRTAIDDGLTIAYVFETKPFDPTKDEYKRHAVARVSKASPLWQCLADVRLAIQFRQWFWLQEQPGATLEPGRSVDADTGEITEGTVQPDGLADLSPKARAGVMAAARKFKRSIEAGGTDVTISTPGHEPVTIRGRRK